MAGGFIDKLKDYVKGNPQQAESAIDKAEELIDQRTGGKYADQVDTGGAVLRDQLGLPRGDDTIPSPGPTPDPGPTPTPEPGPTPGPVPTPTPEPGPMPGPVPTPDPGPVPIPEPGPESSVDAGRGGQDAGQTSTHSTDPHSTETGEAGSVPNPSPGIGYPEQGSQGDLADGDPGALTPGGPQRPGEPGGPLDAGDVPGAGTTGPIASDTTGPSESDTTGPSENDTSGPSESDTTGPSDGGAQDQPLPQGGTTQQGEPQSPTPTPGGTQPDAGGPAQVPTDEPGSGSVPGPGPDTEGPQTGAKELPPFGQS